MRRSSPAASWSHFPVAHAPIELDDAAQQSEEQSQRVVGHLVDAVVGDVAHPDPARGRFRDVDVIEADARCRDHTQAGKPCEVVGRDGIERERTHDVAPRPRR